MIRVFIDESGNMGRGGQYFVLAAVVCDTDKGDQRIKRIIRKEQQIIAKDRMIPEIEEIKSSFLTFPQRQRILNKIVARTDVDLYYLVVDKNQVELLQYKKPKNLVYNYFAKLLTDKVFAKYNDNFSIIFDQRSTSVKSMHSLIDYITINAYTLFHQVENNVEVRQMDSKTSYNLQAADILAGTIYQAYVSQKRHFLELIKRNVINANEFPKCCFAGSLNQKIDD